MGIPIYRWTAMDVARNIVNQLGDLWEVDVDVRQATNATANQFVKKLIKLWAVSPSDAAQWESRAYEIGFADGEEAAYENIHAIGQEARSNFMKRQK